MIVWNNGILTTIPPNGDIPIIMTQDIITEAEMVIDIEMTDTDPDDLYIVGMSVIAMIITGIDDIDTIVFSELS